MGKESVSVVRYSGVFALAYAGLLLGLNIFTKLSGIELGGGANAGIAIAAVYASAAAFVNDHGRIPTTSERRWLAWGSVAAAFFVSFGSVYLVMISSGESPWAVFVELLNRVTPVLFGVAFVIITLVYYLLLGFCYGCFGKIITRAHSKG